MKKVMMIVAVLLMVLANAFAAEKKAGWAVSPKNPRLVAKIEVADEFDGKQAFMSEDGGKNFFQITTNNVSISEMCMSKRCPVEMAMALHWSPDGRYLIIITTWCWSNDHAYCEEMWMKKKYLHFSIFDVKTKIIYYNLSSNSLSWVGNGRVKQITDGYSLTHYKDIEAIKKVEDLLKEAYKTSCSPHLGWVNQQLITPLMKKDTEKVRAVLKNFPADRREEVTSFLKEVIVKSQGKPFTLSLYIHKDNWSEMRIDGLPIPPEENGYGTVWPCIRLACEVDQTNLKIKSLNVLATFECGD